MNFPDLLARNNLILMEGGTTERIRRDPGLCLDGQVGVSSLLLDRAGQEALGSILAGYIRIGQESGLPMIIGAPTWRAGRDRCRAAGLEERDLNLRGVDFALGLKRGLGDYAAKVIVAGYLACCGDAYDPGQALDSGEAEEYHSWQARRLARAGADLLFAATLPAASEALGLARAMAATSTPYLLSFIIRPSGELLDGTPLDRVMDRIDREADPAPACYMVNCVHPGALAQALEARPGLASRLAGIQANTSDKPPEDLDGSAETETMDPDEFARAMLELHSSQGIKILGGCCGTDDRHIRALADLARGAAA